MTSAPNVLNTTATARVTVALGGDHEPKLIAELLRANGHDATVVSTGWQAFHQLHEHATALMIVDAQQDGFAVQQRLNLKGSPVGLLFLGDHTTTSEERVRALRNGADDFVTRPYIPAELVERVTSILRRISHRSVKQTSVRYGDLEINVASHEVRRRGVLVQLTMTEFRLLHYLVSQAPRVLSKRQIVEEIWGEDFDGDLNVVETFISYLRKKVDDGFVPMIRTVRGIGYAMTTENLDGSEEPAGLAKCL
jgi:two-component system, OmpR family, response regulator